MTTYIGKTSTGVSIKRKTNNVYTHAVVWLRPNGTIIDKSFCGNYEKALSRNSAYVDKDHQKEIVKLEVVKGAPAASRF